MSVTEPNANVSNGPGNAGYLPQLTALRGIAAFTIFFGHFTNWLWLNPAKPTLITVYASNLRYVAMPLFFVLSGFVIHLNFAKYFRGSLLRTLVAKNYMGFLAKRFLRLYPLYILLLAVESLTDQTLFNPTVNWGIVLRYITLTQSWTYLTVNGQSVMASILGISWSISTELGLYIFYPIVCAVLWRCRTSKNVLAVAVGVLLIAVAMSASIAFFPDQLPKLLLGSAVTPMDITNVDEWFLYQSIWMKMCDFVLGGLCAHYLMLRKREPSADARQAHIATAVILLAIFVEVATVIYPDVYAHMLLGTLFRSCLFTPLVAVLILTAVQSSCGLYKMKPLQTCGLISYSIYLLHHVLGVRFDSYQILQSPELEVTWFVSVALASLVIIACAYGTYVQIERPFHEWSRKIKLTAVQRFDGG